MYRDPRYETFRVFFVKDGTIVHATGVSARMPGHAPMIPAGMGRTEYLNWMRDQMQATGADSYYLLHNHPSGIPQPSDADRGITQLLDATVPGMRAHVIINSNKFAVMTPGPAGDLSERVAIRHFGEDGLLMPSKPMAMLGEPLTTPDQVAAMGKSAQRPGWITLVGRGSDGKVRAVAEAPSSILTRDYAYLAATVRRFMRASGSRDVVAVGSNADMNSRPILHGVRVGILLDAVPELGQSLRAAGVAPVRDEFAGTKGRMVAEPEHGDAFAPGPVEPARAAGTFAEARIAARDFQGKPLVNAKTGLRATVSRNALDKMLSGKAVTKSTSPAMQSLAVANLDQLFAQAMLGWSKPDAKGSTNLSAIHRFFVPMVHGGRMLMVKMTVKETAIANLPNPLYTVEALEFNEESPAAQWVDATLDADGIEPISIRSAGEVSTLAQRVEDFNRAADGGRGNGAFARGGESGVAGPGVSTTFGEITPTASAPDVDEQGLPPRRRTPSSAMLPQTPADAGVSVSGSQPSAPQFTVIPNPHGTVTVHGDAAAIRAQLAAHGVTSAVPALGGVLVGRSQAQRALEALAASRATESGKGAVGTPGRANGSSPATGAPRGDPGTNDPPAAPQMPPQTPADAGVSVFGAPSAGVGRVWTTQRGDGSLLIRGPAAAIRQRLYQAGVPVLRRRNGLVVGSAHAASAQAALDGWNPPAAATGGSARILARVNKGKNPHSELNGSIAEFNRFHRVLSESDKNIAVVAPGKTSARGVDFAIFNEGTKILYLEDTKYRSPGGRYPKSVPNRKKAAWTREVRNVVKTWPEGSHKTAILRAIAQGDVVAKIGKWP